MANSISVAVGDNDTMRDGRGVDAPCAPGADAMPMPVPVPTAIASRAATTLVLTGSSCRSRGGRSTSGRGALPHEPGPFLEAGSSRVPAGDLARHPRGRLTVAG